MENYRIEEKGRVEFRWPYFIISPTPLLPYSQSLILNRSHLGSIGYRKYRKEMEKYSNTPHLAITPSIFHMIYSSLIYLIVKRLANLTFL